MERQVMLSLCVCVCLCVCLCGQLLHSSETFMKKSFLTDSLLFACLYICSHGLFIERG